MEYERRGVANSEALESYGQRGRSDVAGLVVRADVGDVAGVDEA